MNEKELRNKINESPEKFFRRDNSGKGFVCELCGSGTGKNGTGLTAKRMSDGKLILTCWACGESGDVIHWLEKTRGMSYREVLESASRDLGQEVSLSYQRHEEVEENYNGLYERAEKNLSCTDYWQRRGLSLETCLKFRLGYIEEWRHPKAPMTVPVSPRLIIPISSRGYLARDVREKIPEREQDYKKSKVGKIGIFNVSALKEKLVYVVEGEIDAMSFFEVGKSAVALGSIAYKKKFIEVVKSSSVRPEIFIIALDSEKSKSAAVNVRKTAEYIERELKLLGVFVLTAEGIYGDYKDANEYLVSDREGFKNSVESVEQMALKMKARVHQNKVRTRRQYLSEGMLQRDIDEFHSYVNRVTGYKNIDDHGSLYPGLYVLGAVTGLGKTTFMNQMTEQMSEKGQTILFISYEQTMFELMSKGISRSTYKTKSRFSSIDIRRGAKGTSISEAIEKYVNHGANEYIYEAEFDDTVDVVCEEIEKFVMQGLNPIVIIDYLQVIAPSESKGKRQSQKETVDEIVKKLKTLQRKYGLVVFLISSLNRQNYLTQIDFESFKESGGIEYTADVVWGLQLACMKDKVFKQDRSLNEKREVIKKARAMNPRQVELVCLKNRYGQSGYSCYFNYYPANDYFEPCDEKDIKSIAIGESTSLTKEDEEIMT